MPLFSFFVVTFSLWFVELQAALDYANLGCNNYIGKFIPRVCFAASSVNENDGSNILGCREDGTMVLYAYDNNKECGGNATTWNEIGGTFAQCDAQMDCGYLAVTQHQIDTNCSSVDETVLHSVTDICVDHSGSADTDSDNSYMFTCNQNDYTFSSYATNNCSGHAVTQFTVTASQYKENYGSPAFDYAIYCSSAGAKGICNSEASDSTRIDQFAVTIVSAIASVLVVSLVF